MKACITALVLMLSLTRLAFAAVGFQEVAVPDPEAKPILVAVWYPTQALPSSHQLGMLSQSVAVNGEVYGSHLPFILISHGASGSLASHYDTALALAQAGFVVAAPTHTGDNYMDQSYAAGWTNLVDRPRQVKAVLDWMLSSWTARNSIDASRTGMFGFSLGGFTTLVEIGGTPELSRMALLCSTRPMAPECAFIKSKHGNQLDPHPPTPSWVHDSWINAAVITAPAVSFLFGPDDLRNVQIPVQLWRAENDQQAPDAWNSEIVAKGLPIAPEEHIVSGEDHFIFLAPCSAALAAPIPEICRDTPGFDRSAFHHKFDQSVAAFFSKELMRQ
jgi:predicted dienelactone hydrolase